MSIPWLALLAVLLLLVATGLLIAAYAKLSKQKAVIDRQNLEIERQLWELTSQNNQAQELNREKTQLVLLVSHDLKGPFNRLFALVQLLGMDADNLTAEQKEYLGKMYQIVCDGLNMVRNLIDVRKLEERGVDPHPEPFNVSSVITAIVNQYRIPAEKKSIAIHFDGPGFDFVTDRNYLSRVFENLLSNAIKFSPHDKNVFVTLKKNGVNEIVIAVRDEGPGLSVEDQAQLYQRFQKLTSKPTDGESSTGLGLAIVKQLVTSMRGDVSCLVPAGGGATFTVRLPAMTKEAIVKL